jgi:tetratricopeptide (TPR) repeat protein
MDSKAGDDEETQERHPEPARRPSRFRFSMKSVRSMTLPPARLIGFPPAIGSGTSSVTRAAPLLQPAKRALLLRLLGDLRRRALLLDLPDRIVEDSSALAPFGRVVRHSSRARKRCAHAIGKVKFAIDTLSLGKDLPNQEGLRLHKPEQTSGTMPNESSVTSLTLPPGLRTAKDPLRKGLAELLRAVSHGLENQGLLGAAWPFRQALDLTTIFLAAAAIAPLSPGEAPLPGWRRELWKSEFADMAPGLLNWAVAYLPKRSRQNRLAAHLLNFLFEDGSRHLAGKPRAHSGMFGLGDPAITDTGAWQEWRERFFSRDDTEGIAEAASGLTTHLENLSALLPNLDDFLASLGIGMVSRGDNGRLTLNLGGESEELVPFLLVRDCPQCGRKDALFALTAPNLGERYPYREISTGHLVPFPVDSAFQRRFFTGGAPTRRKDYPPLRPQGLERLVERSERARPGTASEGVALFQEALTPEVWTRYHLPTLMILCQAGEPLPLEVLADPSLGCRDAVAVAGRLIGLVVFWENGAVEPASPTLAAELNELFPAEATQAARRLALWAEAFFQEPGGANAGEGMAGRGLARWALASGDAELCARLAQNPEMEKELLRWLAEEEEAGRRAVVLQVSQDWLKLLADSSVPLQQARMHALRGGVRRRTAEHALAREELDRALALAPAGPATYEFRARTLTERARAHLDLRQPASAAEDGAQAAEAWKRLTSVSPDIPGAVLAGVELASLRGKALQALGQSRQAAALMQKVADGLPKPQSEPEILAWIQLRVSLGELLRGLGDNTGARKHFRKALELFSHAPAEVDLREARASALRGAAGGEDAEVACKSLAEARELLEALVQETGRADLRPALAGVLDELATARERTGLLAEAREAGERANDLFARLLEEEPGRPEWQTARARVLGRQARLSQTMGRTHQAEEELSQAIELLQGLSGDTRSRLRKQELDLHGQRAALKIEQERWTEALEDLGTILELGSSEPGGSALIERLARAHRDRGRILVKQGLSSQALQDFDQAVELISRKGDHSFRAEIARDRAPVLLASGFPERAEEDCTLLLERGLPSSEKAETQFLRGVARLRAGRLNEALEDFTEAGDSCSEPRRCRVGRGLAHLRLNHKDKALACFQGVLDEIADQPPAATRVEAVLAHGGLATLRESVGGAEQARADWSATARAWGSEGAEPGFFAGEVGKILAQAGQAHLAYGDHGVALSCLRTALELLDKPTAQDQSAAMHLRVRGTIAQALAGLGREREAVDEARAALEVPESILHQEPELAANLHFFCGQVLVSSMSWDEAAQEHLEQAITLYRGLLKERWDAGVQSDLALTLVLRGTVRSGAGELASAVADLDEAVELLESLRTRMDGRGLEWELALALVRRAEALLARDEAAAASSSLTTASRILPAAPAPRPIHVWVRSHFLEALAGLLASEHSLDAWQVLGSLTCLDCWSWAERNRLEESWCALLQTDLGQEVLPILAGVVGYLASSSTLEGRKTAGTQLLQAWCQRGLALAESDHPMAESLLRSLVDLVSSGPWSPEIACDALKGLANLWEKRGEPTTALQYLDKAFALVDSGESKNAPTAASVLLCRTRLADRMGKREDARISFRRVLELLRQMPPATVPSSMRTEVSRLQGVLELPGLLPDSEAGVPAPETPPATEAPAAAPLDVPSKAEPAPPKTATLPEQARPASPEAPTGLPEPAPEPAPAGAVATEVEQPHLAAVEASPPAASVQPMSTEAWNPDRAHQQLDAALEALDSADLAEAERLLLEVGHDLPRSDGPPSPDVLELLPGLLEGLQGVVDEMLERGWLPRALAIAEYGSSLANNHLATSFDQEAWPWWGDVEFILGRLHRELSHLDKSAVFFRRAREIYTGVAAQGGSEESWLDACRAAMAGATTWQDLGVLGEAEVEYSQAVELTTEAMRSNPQEGINQARVYMSRGRLRIQAGQLPEALPDYEYAMDLYVRFAEAGHSELLPELGAARIGMAEVLYRLGRRDEAEAWRLAASETMDQLLAQGKQEEASVLGELLNGLETFRPQP